MSASELNMRPEDRGASQTPPREAPPDGQDVHFDNFDQKEHYLRVKMELENPAAKNFVVEFGAENCRIATDLTLPDFRKLLSQKRDPAHPIRWMFVLPFILYPRRQNQRLLILQKYMEPVLPG